MLKNLQKWTYFLYTSSYEIPDPAKKIQIRISNTAGKSLIFFFYKHTVEGRGGNYGRFHRCPFHFAFQFSHSFLFAFPYSSFSNF
jgi:hypothetical protein